MPKRPRRSGNKLLITEHPYRVTLPKTVPEYLAEPPAEFVDTTEKPHMLHVVTRLKKRGLTIVKFSFFEVF